MTIIPLARAYLCDEQTCKVITDNGRVCPACGGRLLWPLADWLERERTETRLPAVEYRLNRQGTAQPAQR